MSAKRDDPASGTIENHPTAAISEWLTLAISFESGPAIRRRARHRHRRSRSTAIPRSSGCG
jgi:hypothetical protein